MSDSLRRAVQEHLDARSFPAHVAAVSVKHCPAGFPFHPEDDSDWNMVRAMVDDIYQCVDEMLSALQTKAGFSAAVWKRLRQGRKLMVRPAAGSTIHMDGRGRGSSRGESPDAGWAFTAAVMRWFHDHPRISYYDMCLGVFLDVREGVTGEALIEGYPEYPSGWGFYSVRRYLADASDPGLGDDPLRGLEESTAGIYLPPGAVFDRMMVYDLNRNDGDETRQRELVFPDGGILMIHKAFLGGDPGDEGDRVLYPGAIPVNLVRLEKANPDLIADSIARFAGNMGVPVTPGDALLARVLGEEQGFMLHLVDAGGDGIIGLFVCLRRT
ncbi:MAG TPA: hypothetical protein ENN35_07100 [Deltaproteobacteria bacterium]|nr:hypothetical protein [Deltaproteobacteria bacterium]